jgi:hypothetical protein
MISLTSPRERTDSAAAGMTEDGAKTRATLETIYSRLVTVDDEIYREILFLTQQMRRKRIIEKHWERLQSLVRVTRWLDSTI